VRCRSRKRCTAGVGLGAAGARVSGVSTGSVASAERKQTGAGGPVRLIVGEAAVPAGRRARLGQQQARRCGDGDARLMATTGGPGDRQEHVVDHSIASQSARPLRRRTRCADCTAASSSGRRRAALARRTALPLRRSRASQRADPGHRQDVLASSPARRGACVEHQRHGRGRFRLVGSSDACQPEARWPRRQVSAARRCRRSDQPAAYAA
jgi:hypothetical protein